MSRRDPALDSLHPSPRSGSRTWLAGVVCFVLVAFTFRHAITAMVIALAAWIIHRIVVRRDGRVLLCVVSSALSLLVFEYAGGKYLEGRIAETYMPGIDHRL